MKITLENLVPHILQCITRKFHNWLKLVWQRGRGCVSSKTHWLSVWLRKKSYSLCMGPTMNCVRNAGNLKSKKCCFFARLFQNNHATLFKQCSMIHWTVYHASTVHWIVEHVNSANCTVHVKFLFFFFSVC